MATYFHTSYHKEIDFMCLLYRTECLFRGAMSVKSMLFLIHQAICIMCFCLANGYICFVQIFALMSVYVDNFSGYLPCQVT